MENSADPDQMASSEAISTIIPCIQRLHEKQCRSRSDGFFRNQLIWIYTVFQRGSVQVQQEKGYLKNMYFIVVFIKLL